MSLIFEWDEEKDTGNQEKHEVSFEEAKTIFNDPLSMTVTDTEHSISEHRFIDVGCSVKGRILVVVYTERGSHIRIISCRKATGSERRVYYASRI